MAQVLHPAFAEGTFNAGLLSTEAGTLGRFTGNLLLSVSARITGLDSPAEVRATVKHACAGVGARRAEFKMRITSCKMFHSET